MHKDWHTTGEHAPTWSEGEVLSVHGKDVEVAILGFGGPAVVAWLRFMPGLRPERGHRVAICQLGGYETCVTAITGFNPATFRPEVAS